MGDVFRARDTILDRTVAVKVLGERYAAHEETRRRFRREAQAGARLSGLPHTVMTFDVGEWHEQPFIVMEYLGGGTLADVIRAGPVSPEQALAWIDQAALSLDAAHAMGVVHRDVKPGNLLLDDDGELHVADFGIATAAGLESFTQTGTILGTAGYLSPEQADGRPATPASDRYALAVVAFELLTGSRPFAGATLAAEVAAHAYGEVPSASKRHPSVPAAVDAVFRNALEKRPDRRYPRCVAFAAALRAAYAGAGLAAPLAAVPASELPTLVASPEDPRRPERRVLLLVVLAAAVVLVAGLLSGAFASGWSPTDKAAAVHRPSGPALLVRRGLRLMRARRYAAALPLLERAVARLDGASSPTAAAANATLGETLVHLGRCQASLPYLERAVSLRPASTAAATELSSAQRCAAPVPTPPVRHHHEHHTKPHEHHPKPPEHHGPKPHRGPKHRH
jgi:tetratricopeptide (TPR) repeat protein